MNRNFTLLTALGAGLALAPFSSIALAQAAAAPKAPAPAPTVGAAAEPASVTRIALLDFQKVVVATNEGQNVLLAMQKKYEPKQNELQKLAADVEALKKASAALPATTSDEVRAAKLREIDTKEKHLNQDAQEASEAYNAEVQEQLSQVAKKIAEVVNIYAEGSGYTLVLDVSGQTNNVFWASPKVHQDISQAIVDAYNKSSGVAAPIPPSPKPSTTPAKPAATKPPVK